jgi:hypothetical protein
MATYDEVIQALRNADAQGNVEDARRLAQIAQSMRQQSATTEQPQTPVAQQPPAQRGMDNTFARKTAELISPTYSLLRGAVIQPLLGANELLARTGLFGESVKQGAIRNVQTEQLMSETLKKAAGREGFDVPELAGAVFSPINKLFPTAGVSKLMAGGVVQGGIMPSGVSEESYLSDKLFNMGLGGIIGGAIPVASKVLKEVKDYVSSLPITDANKMDAARKYINELAGPRKNEVINALRNAGQIVTGSKPTSAEALAESPTAIGLIKEQQRLASQIRTAPQFAERAKEQAAARKGELTSAFGTKEDLEAAQKLRTAETTPMRETALDQANVFGQNVPRLQADVAQREAQLIENLRSQGMAATGEAQALVRESTAPQGAEILSATGRVINPLERQIGAIAGMPMKFPDRYKGNYELAKSLSGAVQEFADPIAQRKSELAFKQLQLKSVADEGFYPLSTSPLLSKIEQSLQKPGERANTLLTTSLDSLKTKLNSLTDENGIINSLDLYQVRKEIGDDIRAFLTQRNQSFGAQATNVESTIKKILDDSINKASGTNLWSNYLEEFATHSKKINQMEVGQTLVDKLSLNLGDVEKAGVFANAVDNASALIKRTTGVQRYNNLSEFLTGDQIKSVESVRADLARKQKAFEAGKQVRGQEPAAFASGEEIPTLLNAKISLAKSVLDYLKRGSQKDLDDLVSDLTLNPQKLADFLEVIPKKDTEGIVGAMMAKLSPEVRNQTQAFIRNLTPTEVELTRGAISTATQSDGSSYPRIELNNMAPNRP